MSLNLNSFEQNKDLNFDKFYYVQKNLKDFYQNNINLIDEFNKKFKNILTIENFDFFKLTTINEKVTYLTELEEKIVQENINFIQKFKFKNTEFLFSLFNLRENLEIEQKKFSYKNNNVDLNHNKGFYNLLKTFGKNFINNKLSKYYNKEDISIENKLKVLKTQLDLNNLFKTELSKKLFNSNLIIEHFEQNIQNELSLRKEDIEAASKNGGEILEPKSELYKKINKIKILISKDCDNYFNNLLINLLINKKFILRGYI